MTISRGYAGMSPGSPMIRVRLELDASPEAARYLTSALRTGEPMDVEEQLLGPAGVQRRPVPPEATSTSEARERLQDITEACAARGYERSDGPLDMWLRERLDAANKGAPIIKVSPSSEGQMLRRALDVIVRVARLAGFSDEAEARANPEGLVEAVDKLRVAALPPYEPKTEPAVARCPECGGATIVRLARRTQKEFTGCVNWPACSWVHVPPKKAEDTKQPGYVRRKLEID